MNEWGDKVKEEDDFKKLYEKLKKEIGESRSPEDKVENGQELDKSMSVNNDDVEDSTEER